LHQDFLFSTNTVQETLRQRHTGRSGIAARRTRHPIASAATARPKGSVHAVGGRVRVL